MLMYYLIYRGLFISHTFLRSIPIISAKESCKETIVICMDYIALLETGRTATKALDVIKGSTVTLICRFCEGNTNFQTITWHYRKRGEKVYQDINEKLLNYLPMMNTSENYRDILNIENFSDSNSGIYTCKYIDVYYEGIFVYVLDEVFNDSVPSKTGSMKEWYDYKDKYLDVINYNFEHPTENPFNSIAKFRFSFKVVTSWGNWGRCEPLNRYKGVRKKTAKYWLHPYLLNSFLNTSDPYKNLTHFFCGEPYDLPCRSIKVSELLPEIGAIIRYIPYFEVLEDCDVLKESSLIKKETYKYTIVKYIAESGHITLQCPEITTESRIEWYKDGYLLNSTFRNNLGLTEDEPHITIDSRHSLYILHASKREEGTYVCFLDGLRKQSYRIKVVSMSRLLNQEFLRYSIYLAFVLSLTLICYCTGILVAWHRRASFLDPLNLHNN